MSAISFTDRELKRAWREHSKIATHTASSPCTNSHRLLLFYAVECGLKAVLLKRQGRNLFDRADINLTGHNLRLVLKELRVGVVLSLPENLEIEGKESRKGDISILHQAWRYGGKCLKPTDDQYEQHLRQVLNWIRGELK